MNCLRQIRILVLYKQDFLLCLCYKIHITENAELCLMKNIMETICRPFCCRKVNLARVIFITKDL